MSNYYEYCSIFDLKSFNHFNDKYEEKINDIINHFNLKIKSVEIENFYFVDKYKVIQIINDGELIQSLYKSLNEWVETKKIKNEIEKKMWIDYWSRKEYFELFQLYFSLKEHDLIH